MKNLLILIIPLLLFLPNELTHGQATPDQLVPPPDFARYHPEMSDKARALALQMEDMNAVYGSRYDGRRHIRYEAVDMDVKFYTTPRPIEEVRELYFDLFLKSMQQQGMPPDALEEFEDHLEYEIIETIEEEPMFNVDLDMVEEHYTEAGLTEIVELIQCYRKLRPQTEPRMKKVFSIEMNEFQLRRPDTIQDGSNFYIIEVEVEQPYVDIVDCRLVDDTLIVYSIYHMVVSIE